MAALLSADELYDVRTRLNRAEAELARLRESHEAIEAAAARAVSAAAARLEELTAHLDA